MSDLVKLLEWDSEFFGFRIGRLLPAELTPEQVEESNLYCQDNDIKFLYWLADPRQPDLGEIARFGGFRFMDFRLELNRQMKQDATPQPDLHPNVRLYNTPDLNALISIAKDVHTDSRFALDPTLNPKSALLFEKWILRDVSRQNSAVMVADIGEGACGYCTCHPHPEFARIGQIGLVGVDPNNAGKGLGKALLHAAMNWFTANEYESVQVVTQGANIAAQRLYQSISFKTFASGVWFHRDF